MKTSPRKFVLLFGLAATGWLCSGPDGGLIAEAHAVIGRPATPVSYAGVARRTTVRVATPSARSRGCRRYAWRRSRSPRCGRGTGKCGRAGEQSRRALIRAARGQLVHDSLRGTLPSTQAGKPTDAQMDFKLRGGTVMIRGRSLP